MGNVAIFKGKVAKFLVKAGILIPARSPSDRSISPENGEIGYNTTTNRLETYENGNWVDVITAPAGEEFAFLDDQSTPSSITNFIAPSVLSSKFIVGIYREATVNKYETLEVLVVKKASSYEISVNGVGDSSGVSLSITSAGQIQYTSTSVPGHNATNSKIYWKQQVSL